jgi:hypothetical protein
VTRDPAFASAVARGAAVDYQTLNPPYPEWTAQFPAVQAGVLAAAEATGARLVSMENVYMYGRPASRPLTEDRAHTAEIILGRRGSSITAGQRNVHPFWNPTACALPRVRVTVSAAAVLELALAAGPPGPTAEPSRRPVPSRPPARGGAVPSRRPG